MPKMHCETIWTAKVEAQICDLLNESGLRMSVDCETIWSTKVEAQIYDLLNENDIHMPEMRFEPYEPQRLKPKFVICWMKG